MLKPNSAYPDARVGETVNSFLITAFLDNNLGLVEIGIVPKFGAFCPQLLPPLLQTIQFPSSRHIISKPHLLGILIIQA